ncbi:MAG: hypothetical protein ACE5JD_04835 [Candidatus Methylomirabilia bacterium]
MTVRRLVWIAFVLTAAAEVFLGAGEASLPWWHRTLAFHAAYGLIGCVLIVVVSKALGKFWLQRPEAPDD